MRRLLLRRGPVLCSSPAIDAPSDAPISLVTIPNVELIEVGLDWHTMSGDFTFEHEDLVSAIASQSDPAVRTPVVKLGHIDPRFGGQPSFGRIENMHLTNNGQTLVGDLVGVPVWLAEIMPTAFPRRSVEGWFADQTRTGNTWPFVLTAVALLGDVYPAIETLEDLKLCYGAEPPVLLPVGENPTMLASAEDALPAGMMRMSLSEEDAMKWLTRRKVMAGATAYEDLPMMGMDTDWDGSAAETALKAWASSDGSGDKATIDWAKFSRGFAWHAGDSPPENFGDYKLPFAMPDGSSLKAVPAGVMAVANRLPNTDIPADDVTGVQTHMGKYYGKMRDQFDDFETVPPWETGGSDANAAGRRQPTSVNASSSIDDVISALYDDFDDTGRFWWWIRTVLVNPTEVICDDDVGHLYRIPFTVGTDDTVTFDDPVQVRIVYEDIPEAQQVAAAAASACQPGQFIAASYADRDATGRPKQSTPTAAPNRTVAASTPSEVADVKFAKELLAKLGLAEDAGEDEIAAAVAAAVDKLDPADAGTAGDAGNGDETQAGSGDATPTGPADVAPPAAGEGDGLKIPDGMVLVDKDTLDSMKGAVEFVGAERARRATEERDNAIKAAVGRGSIAPSRREHYEAAWSADAEGTKQALASLAPNLVPVQAQGYVGGDPSDPGQKVDAYPAGWRKHVEAAQKGVSTKSRIRSLGD